MASPILHVTDLEEQTGSAWLGVVPPAGLPLTVSPGGSRDITILVDATGLTAGTYTDRILVSSDDPDENPYPTGVDVTLYVHATCEQAPTAPHTPTPGDASANVAIDTTLAWLGGHPCAGEPVTYDVYLEAGDATPDVLAATALATPQLDPGDLLSATTYYWQVIAQGLNGPTAGPIWSFTTAAPASPPAAPTLTSPADGAETCDTTPTFTWTPAIETDTVDLQVSANGFVTNVIAINTAATSYTPASGLALGAYQWRARGRNANGAGNWSAPWSFEVIAAPDAPTLTAPAAAAELCDATPALTWSEIAAADSYTVQIAANIGFSSPQVQETVATATFAPATDLLPGLWYWRVRANNACGSSAWTAARTFTVVAVPGTPGLVAPANGVTTWNPRPTLDWDAACQCGHLHRAGGR